MVFTYVQALCIVRKYRELLQNTDSRVQSLSAPNVIGAEHDTERRHVPHQPGADQPALVAQCLHLQPQDI
jgi:hypothetical protein